MLADLFDSPMDELLGPPAGTAIDVTARDGVDILRAALGRFGA
ncbi:hypothetical protein [Pseudonocardia sp. DLS-67]